jgi:aspartyl-tRNA synthetase
VFDCRFAWLTDRSQERLVFSAEKRASWLSGSSILPGASSADLSAEQLERDVSEMADAISKFLRLQSGDTVWFGRRKARPEVLLLRSSSLSPSHPASLQGGWTSLGRVRTALAEKAQELGTSKSVHVRSYMNTLRRIHTGDYRPATAPQFLWVTEFPLFTRADEDKDFLAHGRWSSSHHPFTAPMLEDIDDMYAGRIERVHAVARNITSCMLIVWHILQVRGQHYDLVLNGVEIGGGSVRVHDAEMQEYIFSNILQVSLGV